MNIKIENHLLPILGAIAGDIIGSPYELEGKKIKRTDFPLFCLASTFTDDTVLSLSVAKWLCDRKNNLSEITHSMGLDYIDVGFGHSFKTWLRTDNPEPYNSWGNGSAMRVSAIGVYASTINEVLELAEISACITHNHPEGIKGAQAVAIAIFLAYRGFTKNNIREYIEQHFKYDLNRTIDSIRPTYKFDSSCKGSVPEAIIAFLESENVEHAIRLAVSLGGDADTQASIAGAIAAAFYKKIPSEIQDLIFQKLPKDLLNIVFQFNSFSVANSITLALTAKDNLKMKSYIRYTFALAVTDKTKLFIPKNCRLEADIAFNEPIFFHVISHRDEIFKKIEESLDKEYPGFKDDYSTLCNGIQIYSDDSAILSNFIIDDITLDDILDSFLIK